MAVENENPNTLNNEHETKDHVSFPSIDPSRFVKFLFCDLQFKVNTLAYIFTARILFLRYRIARKRNKYLRKLTDTCLASFMIYPIYVYLIRRYSRYYGYPEKVIVKSEKLSL